ncbi:hypothetical protein [Bradyrhizobium sp. USDA 4508]
MPTFNDPGEEHNATVPTTGHITAQNPPGIVGSLAPNAFLQVARNPAEWWGLSIELRRQWWQETNFGTVAPSAALVDKVRAALEADRLLASPTVTPPHNPFP